MGQRQLLERAVPDVRGELIELFVEGRRQGLLQLLLYLAVDPPQMIDGPRLRADPTSLLEDLAGHPRDAKESLGVKSKPWGGYVVRHLRLTSAQLLRLVCHGFRHYREPRRWSVAKERGWETFERARGAFGAARAFPIRERYLLGTSDPLKSRSRATQRPSGRPEPPTVREGIGRLLPPPIYPPRSVGSTTLRAVALRVRCTPWGDPGPSLRPWPLGTGAKGSKGPHLVSNPTEALSHNDSHGFSQVVTASPRRKNSRECQRKLETS